MFQQFTCICVQNSEIAFQIPTFELSKFPTMQSVLLFTDLYLIHVHTNLMYNINSHFHKMHCYISNIFSTMQSLAETCQISCGQSVVPGHNCNSDFFYAPAIKLRLHIKITEVELFYTSITYQCPQGDN